MGNAFGIPSFAAAEKKIDGRLRAAVGDRVAVLERILAMREQELMDRQGPCKDGTCGLWQGHYGPCMMKAVKIKRPTRSETLCVNPKHLQATTPQENTAEMLERRWYQMRILELEAMLSVCDCQVNT